jgi:ribosomal protein L3 glutamine methyltransferase
MFAEAPGRLRTVRDLLRFAVSRFTEAGLSFGHGTDNAWDEAAYLILHALHLPPDRLEPFLDAVLTESELNSVLELLRRRVESRLPAAYLTHEAWLGDFRFYVDERVIVPRSHIAGLLRNGLQPWIADPEAVGTVLELCTGSGCLAIVAAHAFPHARIDATDLSPGAIEVARRNVGDYGLDHRVRLLEGDLWAPVGDERYDLIIANPPYVTAESMRALPPEYRAEPAMALAAGEDGLDVVRRIVAHAREHLNPDGLLLVEVGPNREAVERTWPRLPFTWVATDAGEDAVFLLSAQDLGR